MLDDALDYIEHIRKRPVWQPLPAEIRARFQEPVPHQASDLAEVHGNFLNDIMPYATGNTHPGFMGWVHGGGTPVGVLAEMLAASLNANLGGRDHAPIEVEQQIVRWMREIFGFPESASGLFVTGASMANFIAVLIARDVALGFETRREGVTGSKRRLTAYASAGVHSCVARAMDFCGIGSDALRLIPTQPGRGIDLHELEKAIDADRRAGFTPFLLVGTAGSVDTGAIDDLAALADLSQRESLWFHIDGACGALAVLAPELAPRLSGIERADSLAFDFHKWGQVPYDAGFILVRDGVLHRKAFASSAGYLRSGYLRREESGLAGGSVWPCDFGPDLSRGFRALKTWFTLKVYGIDALGATIAGTCRLARYLESRIQESPDLELLAPVELNIVCFRYRVRDCDADRVNARIVADLQNDGRTAPSTAIIEGHPAIRAAIVNHRTSEEEIDTLIESVIASGRAIEHAVHSRFWRACLLADTGRTDEAKHGFLDLLSQEPAHRGALNEFGLLLQQTGYRTAACTAFTQAVAKHPEDHASRIHLAHALRENGNAAGAREHYEAVLGLAPGDVEAHQGLACVLADSGDREAAKYHRDLGFGGRPVTTLPYRGQSEPVSLLVLSGTAGGNVPIRHLLDDKIFQSSVVFVEYYDPAVPLPHHRLIFNAIGDADSEGRALIAAKDVLAHTTAPIINRPGAVATTGRSDNAQRLSGIAGAITPRAITLPRGLLSGTEAAATLTRYGFEFPLLIRTPGFHTGRYFVRVETMAELPAALAALPGEELAVLQYLDARGADGKVRKYRAMAINGELYPLHAAISSHWKIHYFTAEMAESPQHRAEDAEFLKNMPGVLGPQAMAALTEIQSRLGLDYAGIDFGLNTKGEILIFEANATMVVNPPEQGEKWAYRRPAVERIHAAVRNMLIERSGAGHKGWNSGEFTPMSSAWPVSSGTPNPSLRSLSLPQPNTTMPRW
ncbi:MAG TPA: pyridoxal-dependent decarboxylase [Bryobacteraceae bacterium]|jgi:glutamate/tyrosine decarboxylase-like PLP-dependent enzyme|nr:pyridoxal-dependent decarboxylase [Bryobacteraceae bacterium]